jgi:Leucine-rich repeat (LRR) protein
MLKKLFMTVATTTFFLSSTFTMDAVVDNHGRLDLQNRNLATADLSELLPRISSTDKLKIKTLVLSHNQLTTLPFKISELKNLEVLNLSNNKFTQIPDVCTANIVVPEGVIKLLKLKELVLEGNPLVLDLQDQALFELGYNPMH